MGTGAKVDRSDATVKHIPIVSGFLTYHSGANMNFKGTR